MKAVSAVAVVNGVEIADVMDITQDGMVLCKDANGKYQYIPQDEITIEWREQMEKSNIRNAAKARKIKILTKIAKSLGFEGLIASFEDGDGCFVQVVDLTAKELVLVYLSVCKGIQDTLKGTDHEELLDYMTFGPGSLPDTQQEEK